MQERIKLYLDGLFEEIPKTPQAEDMYEELLAGCLDKYADLTAEGMDEEEAYRKVIGGIGDVKELLAYIEKVDVFDPVTVAEKRKKRAFFTSAGICGYFIALAAFFLLAVNGSPTIGLALLFILIGISTMLIIYGNMTTTVKYKKADGTLVDEMKEQIASGKKGGNKASLASSSLWSLIVAIYLVASFLTGRWDVTWMIFPFAGVLQSLLSARFNPSSRDKHFGGAYWFLVVTVYLIISFWSSSWHITWLIFPCAVAVQQAARLFKVWREEK